MIYPSGSGNGAFGKGRRKHFDRKVPSGNKHKDGSETTLLTWEGLEEPESSQNSVWHMMPPINISNSSYT